MRNIKLTIAYDGTAFQGWQIQKTGRTVQGEVQKSLSRMHRKNIVVTAAGRTDSGVHATGQVINFHSDLDSIRIDRFVMAASSFLPKDIAALKAEEVNMDFHARYSAQNRRYKYFLYSSPVRMPHYRMYSLRICHSPNIAVLNAMAQKLIGEHNFTTFSAVNEQAKSPNCLVYSASFYPHGNFIVFHIEARSFLWKMVRSIVGSLLSYEQKGYTAEEVAQFLLAEDRSLAGMTAQARGLFLDSVSYSPT